MSIKIRTWMVEQTVVATILSLVVFLTHGGWIEWVGAVAVLLSFAHGSVTDRLAEMEGHREKPQVECYKWAKRYFLGKECFWLVYFIAHHSWSALVGVGLFLIYPFWRSFYRSRIKPIEV